MAPTTPTPTSHGSVIACRYEVLKLVGIGGMGTVYRVRDQRLDEIVALKVIRPELVEQPAVVERFREEVRLARRVTHPNVVRTYDIGEHEGLCYLTMEFVDGVPLSQLLRGEGPLGLQRVHRIMADLCAGVSAAHRAGVLHRDLKPDNVLVAEDRAVITDFGIALAVGAGAGTAHGIVGTPSYMAPEQVERGRAVDGRADVYAIGAILYEMLVGQRAWDGDDPFTVALARLRQAPPDPRARRPGLPDALADAVSRAMARDPSERFGDPLELAEAVRVAGAGATTPPPAREPDRPDRPLDDARRVAVLPFSLAGGEGLDYLADGVTEELIDTLSMTRGLRVRPLGSVRAVEGDPRAAGQALGVDVVVSGSIRIRGDQLQIRVRAISVADGFQVWAKRFDCAVVDALDTSDEVARSIAGALTVDLHRPAPEQPPVDERAVQLYLQGRAVMRDAWTGDLTPAIAMLEEAVTLAPHEPRFLAAHALCLSRHGFDLSADWERVQVAAQRAADRAVAAAPDLGESWLALANIRLNALDVTGAAHALRAALARSPGLAKGQEQLGTLLVEAGQLEAGFSRLRAALAIDPTLSTARFAICRAQALVGRLEDAQATMAEGAWGPVAIARARFSMWFPRRFPAEALVETEGDFLGNLVTRVVRSVALSGRIPEEIGDRVLPPPSSASPRTRALHWQITTELLAFAGRDETAVDTLIRGVELGLSDLLWMERCPLLERLRDWPEWPDLHDCVAGRVAGIAASP